MEYKRYTLELKIRFLDTFREMESVAAAARAVGILNDEACYRWARKEDELRASYVSYLKSGKPSKRVHRRSSKVPLEEKIKCIKAIESGLSIHKTSLEFNRNLSTVQNWYRSKNELLELYYSQLQSKLTEASVSGVAREAPMDEQQADEHLVKKCKAMAKEIAFLKDKVEYLKNLNDILKERRGPVKKKIASSQSNAASNQEEET